MEPIDVLVAGAGPSGLTMACELRRFGLRVRVIDPAPRGTEHSRALVVQARTRELFAVMGLGAAVEAAAQPLARINLFYKARPLGSFAVDRIPDRLRPVLLDQSTTEALLAAHLQRLGGAVERGLRLVSFRDLGERVEARVAAEDGSEQTIAARWLVGCDGAHSAVRHGLGLPFEGAAYEDMFDQADLKIRWDHPPGQGFGFLREEGLCVFLPLPGGRHRIMLMGGDGHGPEPTLAMFQRLADAYMPGAELYDVEWIIRFRLHRRMTPTMAVGSVFLAGDAAHIHSPAGGQGMNTGIQDAFNLAWKLAMVAGGAAKPALLATYDAERHPVAARTLAMTDRMFKIATSRRTLLLRRTVMRTVLAWPWLQSRLIGRISQTGVGYRGAPGTLDARRWPRAAPVPGDQAPAAMLQDGPASVSLQALVGESPRMTLLLMHGPTRQPALSAIGEAIAGRWGRAVAVRHLVLGTGDAETLGDPSGAMFRGWRVRAPELALVRPDGHVAARAPMTATAALQAYLVQWFGAGASCD